MSLFCSQVFKTTLNGLNFDGNIGNIAVLFCFLLAVGDKVGSLADVEFNLVWIAGQLSFVLALL